MFKEDIAIRNKCEFQRTDPVLVKELVKKAMNASTDIPVKHACQCALNTHANDLDAAMNYIGGQIALFCPQARPVPYAGTTRISTVNASGRYQRGGRGRGGNPGRDTFRGRGRYTPYTARGGRGRSWNNNDPRGRGGAGGRRQRNGPYGPVPNVNGRIVCHGVDVTDAKRWFSDQDWTRLQEDGRCYVNTNNERRQWMQERRQQRQRLSAMTVASGMDESAIATAVQQAVDTAMPRGIMAASIDNFNNDNQGMGVAAMPNNNNAVNNHPAPTQPTPTPPQVGRFMHGRGHHCSNGHPWTLP